MRKQRNLKMQLFRIFLASLLNISCGSAIPGQPMSVMASLRNVDAVQNDKNIIFDVAPRESRHALYEKMKAEAQATDNFDTDLQLAKREYAKACPNYAVYNVPDDFQGYMNRLWVVTKIIPKGTSKYSDDSVACGLHNFDDRECNCLRYYLGFNEDGSIKMQTMGLHRDSRAYRFVENRVVFVDDVFDVFQSQHIMTAIMSAGSPTKVTSLTEEELSPEYVPFALLGTDNYKTYAVFATCSSSMATPLAWVAFTEDAFLNGVSKEAMKGVYKVLTQNGIDYKQLVSVDQRNCL